MKTTFDINKGVRQGDTISSKLFTNCLEYIFRNINWDTKGININEETLHRLKFADDIVLISDNLKNAKSMLDDLHKECIKCGLRINMSKTKLMCNPKISHAPIQLRGETIQLVQNSVYLGQNICLQDTNQTKEINRRIRLGWATFGKLNSITKGDLPIFLKTKVYNQREIPTITYGSENWTTSQKMENRIRTTQRAMERAMVGITKRDRWRNVSLRNKTKVQDIMQTIRQLNGDGLAILLEETTGQGKAQSGHQDKEREVGDAP